MAVCRAVLLKCSFLNFRCSTCWGRIKTQIYQAHYFFNNNRTKVLCAPSNNKRNYWNNQPQWTSKMRLTNTLRSSQVRPVLHADKLMIIKALFCYTLYLLKIVFISFSSAGLVCTLCAVSEWKCIRRGKTCSNFFLEERILWWWVPPGGRLEES